MITKKRGVFIGVIISIVLLLCCFLSITMSVGTIYASAETCADSSKQYKMLTGNTYIPAVSVYTDSNSGVCEEVSNGSMFGFAPNRLGVYLKGKVGTARYFTNYYIEKVTLSGNVSFSDSTEQSNGNSLEKEVVYSIPTLTSGVYAVSVDYKIANHQSGNNSTEYGTATATFTVDLEAPSITGGSTSPTGVYTKNPVTITASDSLSGVDAIYVKSPTATAYSIVSSTQMNIGRGSANGRYEFYAKDKLGNRSATYYVNYDDTAPTLTCEGGSFEGTVNGSFTVIASDNTSTATLYYKIGNGSWIASGNIYSTSADSNDGFYYFYAVDSYGNKSDEKWVEAKVLYGEFIKSDDNNSVYFTWGCDSWTATLDGSNYTDGDWITDEGKHTVQLSSTNNTALYSYVIDHYFVEETTTATCTTAGYTLYECSQCGESYSTYAMEELGHYYVASTVAPTCTSGGYTKYTCTRCGNYYTDNYTNALGHNYRASATAATCTTSGTVSYTCTRCGTGYSNESAKPLGHSYVEITVAAACEEGGYTLHQCSRCGSSYKDNVSQPLGHNFDVSTTPPTCTEYGKTHYECQVCGFIKDEGDGTYPTGHSYTVTIITEPTCTADGKRKSACDSCGHSFETKIPANGHNYVIADVTESNGDTTRLYTCTICGHSYKQTLGNQYEEVSNYIDYLFEQYAPYMWWVLLASAGVWSIVMGVFFAIAQKNEDKEKARKMIINYIIGIVVIAVIVVAAPYLMKGIASLVS